jgi:hypothetical protein
MNVTLEGLESRGRLGNQMWQVAACLGIAQQIGARPHIPPTWSYRPWFNLPDAFYEPAPPDAMPADQWDGLAHIDPRARMYLQDLGLFVDIASDIRRWFHPSAQAEEAMAADPAWELVRRPHTIALHVRRGDTVTQPKGFQPLAPISFYIDALEGFAPDQPVVVFSDDPKWCRERFAPHFAGRGLAVVDHGNGRSHRPGIYHRQPAMDWLDLQLMAEAAHHVISNSTYAWWSAWLADNPVPRYPSVWWGPNLAYIDSKLMIPDSWIEVPC